MSLPPKAMMVNKLAEIQNKSGEWMWWKKAAVMER
jgi:hypothetical protein